METVLTIGAAAGGIALLVAGALKIVANFAVQEVTLDDVTEGTSEEIKAATARQSLELQLEMAEELGLDPATLNHIQDQLTEATTASERTHQDGDMLPEADPANETTTAPPRTWIPTPALTDPQQQG